MPGVAARDVLSEHKPDSLFENALFLTIGIAKVRLISMEADQITLI